MSSGTGSATGQSNVSAGGGYTGASSGSASGSSVVAARSTTIEVYLTQEAVLASVQSPITVYDTQMATLTLGTQRADNIFDFQLAALAMTQITAKFQYATQIADLVLGASDMPTVSASQVAVLVLARSNPARRAMRAWTFYMDGHHFYVLHLGALTTLVFDTLTRKWSEWRTQDFNNWMANYGTNWNEDIVAGNILGAEIYNVSPEQPTDDGRPITSILTGGYPMRMRDSITCDEVMVTSSVGMGLTVGATLQLRTSDDYGMSWQDWGALALDTATPRTQVTWQSLGEITAPGRIFELTDNGAAKRINSLNLYSRDLEK